MATNSESIGSAIPDGVDSAREPTFQLISPRGSDVVLDLCETDGRASVPFQLRNLKSHTARGTLQLQDIEPPAAAAWFSVVGTPTRDIRRNQTEDFEVRIEIPPDTAVPAGKDTSTFRFSVIGYNEANKEGDHTGEEAQRPTVRIDWKPVPPIRRMSRGKLAAIVLGVLAVLGLLIGAVLWSVWHSTPQKTIDIVNDSAANGDWDTYWDYWTIQGQHKLLYWLCQEVHRDAANNPRWRDEVKAWLGSFGLTLKDLEEFDKSPNHLRAFSATDKTRLLRRKIQEHGRSAKSLFVTAARWNQYTEDDWAEYQKRRDQGVSRLRIFELKTDKTPYSDVEKQDYFDSVLQKFQFQLLCQNPIHEEIGKDVRSFRAVRLIDVKPDEFANVDGCQGCDDAEKQKNSQGEPPEADSPQVSDGGTKGTAIADVLRAYKHRSMELNLHRVDGVWRIDDLISEEKPAGDTFVPREKPDCQIRSVTINRSDSESPQATIVFGETELHGNLVDQDKASGQTNRWKQSFLFIEESADGEDAKRTEPEFQLQTLGNTFLKVILPADNADPIWMSKPEGVELVQVFENLTVAEVKKLCLHLDVTPVILSNGVRVRVDGEKIESNKVSAIYRETGKAIPADATRSLINDGKLSRPIEKLNSQDPMPRGVKLYFECGDGQPAPSQKTTEGPKIADGQGILFAQRNVDGNEDGKAVPDMGAFEAGPSELANAAHTPSSLFALHPKITIELPVLPAENVEAELLEKLSNQSQIKNMSEDASQFRNPSVTVNSLKDEYDGELDATSLREAIQIANLLRRKGPVEINFAESLYENGKPMISLTRGALKIPANVTIAADPKRRVTIRAHGLSRIFEAAGPGITLKGLRLAEGNSTEEKTERGLGGAIYAAEKLTLDSCVLDGNEAFVGGAVYCAEGGHLTLRECWILNNVAVIGGGVAADGSATVENCRILRNHAALAGGLWLNGASRLHKIVVAENVALSEHLSRIDATPLPQIKKEVAYMGCGGGLAGSANIHVTNSIIAENFATYSGGGIMNLASVRLENSAVVNNRCVNRYGPKADSRAAVKNSETFVCAAGIGGILKSNIQTVCSTISGNKGAATGGLFVGCDGASFVRYTTVVGNYGYQSGGISTDREQFTDLKLFASIVADNTGGSHHDIDTHDGVAADYCLIRTPGPVSLKDTGNITDKDPHLGPLADNGGDTPTHALLPMSPAIDTVNSSDRSFPTPKYDQRGEIPLK